MSKKSKQRAKEERLSKKRGIKAANKARYQELARMGANSKSKRFIKNSKKKKRHSVSHPFGRCGNIGCSTCNPELQSKKEIKPVLGKVTGYNRNLMGGNGNRRPHRGITKYGYLPLAQRVIAESQALMAYHKRAYGKIYS